MIPMLGVLAAFSFFQPGKQIPYGESDLLLRYAAWDGGQFLQIMEHGYQFNPNKISNVAMFPGYPCMALLVQKVVGCRAATAMLIVSHVCLLLGFVLLHRYVRLRYPHRPALADWAVIAFGLFPTTFFFRMAYSESLFFLIVLLVLYGVERRWPIEVIALAAGAATAVRLVGVALIIPVGYYILGRPVSKSRRLIEAGLALPLCLWGAFAFITFQLLTFDDAFAFLKAQDNYRLRPTADTVEHFTRLLTLEPIWGTYLPSSDCYWQKHASPPAWFNLQFFNPLYFLGSVFLIAIGWTKKWLNPGEVFLAAGILAISYAGRAEEFCMGSQGRYAAAAVPVYIVWAQALDRLPRGVSLPILGIWGSLLGCYAALFASWYFVV
jgi:hypothetical protein